MEMEESHPSEFMSDARRVAPFLAAVLIAGAGIIFAVREHNNAQAVAAQRQALNDQNKLLNSELSATQNQLDALAAKVSALSTAGLPAAPTSPAPGAGSRPAAGHRANANDPRFKKLQSQLDAQGKAIDAERSDLASTRTELTGSIARTHGELVVLEKKGERNYYEFDLTRTGNFITRTSDFKREGPVSLSLKKADPRHGFADLALIVDDRNLSQKHINLYQPAMFYEPDTMQPVEIVINEISKNHIHGYVSAPKYRKSELAALSNSGNGSAPGTEQAANSGDGDSDIVGAQTDSNAQAAPRQRLPLPKDESSHQ